MSGGWCSVTVENRWSRPVFESSDTVSSRQLANSRLTCSEIESWVVWSHWFQAPAGCCSKLERTARSPSPLPLRCAGRIAASQQRMMASGMNQHIPRRLDHEGVIHFPRLAQCGELFHPLQEHRQIPGVRAPPPDEKRREGVHPPQGA